MTTKHTRPAGGVTDEMPNKGVASSQPPAIYAPRKADATKGSSIDHATAATPAASATPASETVASGWLADTVDWMLSLPHGPSR